MNNPINHDAERAAFETWHKTNRTQPLAMHGTSYANAHVRARWEGWRARQTELADEPVRIDGYSCARCGCLDIKHEP